jgi:4-hydroxy-tetrahydrodipicolinate synthase
MIKLKGIIPALLTPTDDNERVSEEGLRKLIKYVLDGGVHGIFVISSTGESYGLTAQEKRRALEIAVDEVGNKVPVMAGVSAIATRECIEQAVAAQKYGADVVSVLTPMFISPNDDELYNHYLKIADAVDIPLSLYNNPERTGVNLSPALVEKLARHPNIIGIKNTSDNFTLTAEYARRTSGTGFSVMGGRDVHILATLVYGGTGGVVATANIMPKLAVEIYDKFQQGDLEGALAAQRKLAALRMSFNLGTFPAVTKAALNLMGLQAGSPVLPVQALASENMVKLEKILFDLGAMS